MALLWLPLQAFGLATPAATRLMQLGPALQGCMLLQDITSWEVLQKTVETQFADISGSALVAPSPRHGLGLYASTDLALLLPTELGTVDGGAAALGLWRQQRHLTS